MPDATDMDRYYAKAEEIAQARIAVLDAQRQRGEITQEDYEMQVAAAKARIQNQATELAWARHEIVEAEKRQIGVPTGDHPVEVQVPGLSGSGDSFYRRAGQTGGGGLNNNTPFGGSIIGGPNRGNSYNFNQGAASLGVY